MCIDLNEEVDAIGRDSDISIYVLCDSLDILDGSEFSSIGTDRIDERIVSSVGVEALDEVATYLADGSCC